MVTSAKVLLLIEVQGALGLDNYCLSNDRICWLTIPPHLAIVDLIRDFFIGNEVLRPMTNLIANV